MGDNLSEYTDILGTLTHYNGIVFEDFSAEQADCEGALAVGGNAKLGSQGHAYDIGVAGVSGTESIVIGKYENPRQYPSFLLGGEVLAGSTTANVYEGGVALRAGYRQVYESGSFRFAADKLSYVEDELVKDFFSSAEKQIKHTGNVLMNGTEEKIELDDLKKLPTLEQSKYLSKNIKTDKKILIYTPNCTSDEEINISEIDFGSYILEYDAIIINLPAKKVTFSGGAILYDGVIVNTSLPRIYSGNELIELLGTKIIFNFPNAQEVRLVNYGFLGSLFVPNGTVTGVGGSVNGMLAAKSLNQTAGMELHAFTAALGDALWELENKPKTGDAEIIKQDSETLLGLGNAHFALYIYGEESEIGKGVTDENGRLTFRNLEESHYRLVETIPPPGYTLPEKNEWIFKLTIDN